MLALKLKFNYKTKTLALYVVLAKYALRNALPRTMMCTKWKYQKQTRQWTVWQNKPLTSTMVSLIVIFAALYSTAIRVHLYSKLAVGFIIAFGSMNSYKLFLTIL